MYILWKSYRNRTEHTVCVHSDDSVKSHFGRRVRKKIKKMTTGPVNEPADDFMDDDLLENIPASQLVIDGNDNDKDDNDTKVSKIEEHMIMG